MVTKLIKSLNEKGQTTLFKIVGNSNKLNKKTTKKIKKEHFSRFTFLVSLQYLNEKEKFLSEVFIKNNKVIKIDLKSFKTTTGKSKEIEIDNIDTEYEIAKKNIRKKIKKKKKYFNAINLLNEKLEKEIERIYKHYMDQSTEKDFELENAKKRLSQLKSQLNHSREHKEIINLRKNIKFKEEQIKSLKEDEYKKRLENERQFFVEDEKNKYSLNIKIELFNISIFYHNQILKDFS